MENCVPHYIQRIAKIPQTLLMILAYQTLATYREDMYWLSITSRILSPIVAGNLYFILKVGNLLVAVLWCYRAAEDVQRVSAAR